MSLSRFRLSRLLFCLFLSAAGIARADEIVPNAAPRWWKGNIHTHTFWSDGNDFPEMVAEWYRSHGYNFLALTDHNVLAQGIRWRDAAGLRKKGGPDVIANYLARFGPAWVETRGDGKKQEVRLKPLDEFRALVEERGRFLMIPAEEISDKAEGGPVHMNATNLLGVVPPVGGATVREAIANNFRAVHEQAERSGREILVHLNHPNYHYAVTAEDIAHIVLERHFEVYNGHPGTNQHGDHDHPSTERVWDIANTIRLADLNAAPLFGVATDDSHDYHGKPNASHPGRGWIVVRTTHLTPEYLVRAIKAGDFYASSGVTLDDVRYDADSRRLELSIAADDDATFTTAFIGTRRDVDATGKPAEPTGKKEGRYTQQYSERIGEVFATVEGLHPSYTFTGDELYVRAVVTSSRPPADPSFDDQRQQAWTQPVGWSLRAAR
jgi:predicted metal-dependent phosphoesterase TrpH